MPKDMLIKRVLVIGSGPIVIGQAAEFDYSGTQACQALREEGIETILVNSNPATIMTDKEVADKVYIEPMNLEFLEKVIAKERPDSVIAGMGGQTGLNLAVELHDSGILEKYNVRVIGTPIESIKEGEDREGFKALMERIGQPVIESRIVTTMEEGVAFAAEIGYPVVVRPAYTLGGSGGGIAEDKEELKEILATGLQLSRVGQVLLEKSIKGWKEVEYEVMRDSAGNAITVCNMENIDPVGVHTGDSIVVAPSQTLSDVEYQMLRKASLDIINEVGIIGGCNVQLALHPDSFEYAIIEINPRVSRSSALASKATGYPIAKVSAKLALGYRLDEINNAVTKKTQACFEPTLDYCVIKIPKWPFDKFRRAKKTLGTKMMATGEVMAIANNFEAALLKAVRSLEIGQYSLDHPKAAKRSMDELKRRVQVPDDERLFDVAELLRRGYRMDKICKITGMDPFFLNKINNIVELEEAIKAHKNHVEELDRDLMLQLKQKGFSDKAIADFVGCLPKDVMNLRKAYKIEAVYKMVDTCGGEFEAVSPYYYSTYDQFDEVEVSDRRKVLVIGSGPIRIGQGIEFDYCSVHSILALKKAGIETIIANNNPETVSTDFDTADKLYFEPLTEEDVYNIIEKEQPEGVILQFGGQTAIKLASFLKDMNVPILGTQPEQIDEAEDRERFDALMEALQINRPKGKAVWTLEEGMKEAEILSYPVLVRPSYVLGGQGMEITYEPHQLERYLVQAFERDRKNPVLIDRYLIGREIEVDAICDGKQVLIPGIMEHLEKAGVHSGDSISIYPPQNLTPAIVESIIEETTKVALALKVIGMINIQYIEYGNELFIIEVNPRSSRTVPYISKVTGVPMIDLATRIMLGETLQSMGYPDGLYPESSHVAIKVPVFSTQKLPDVEVSLGPEMRSTGEVLGVGKTFEEALYKGFVGSGMGVLKTKGTILATIKPYDQEAFIPIAKAFSELGYQFVATEGTARVLTEHHIPVTMTRKISEGVPNVLDMIRSGLIQMVINTPTKANDVTRDGFMMRRAAIEASVPVLTSLDTAKGMLDIISADLNEATIEIYDLGVNGDLERNRHVLSK